MTISKEAIEAGIKAADHFYLYEATDSDTAFGQAVEAGIRAALPFLPIAGEGKALVDVLRQGIKDQGYGYTMKGNRLTVSSDEVFAVDLDKLASFILSALISSPGKDGGQEVEAPYRWMWEEDLIKSGRWSEQYDDERPAEHPQVRNIRPLYTSPQPASTALVERLTKALEPFCKHYEPWMERWDTQEASSTFSRHTFGDLREALAAINEARAALSASTSREGDDAQD